MWLNSIYISLMATMGQVRCPGCQGALVPTALHCAACDLTVTGRFSQNEFAGLGEEDLHFLRIFVLTEGRIRDMESALGVSYPTIKARMAQLKGALARQTPAATAAPEVRESRPDPAAVLVSQILDQLSEGGMTFDDLMARLKRPYQKEVP
jgi:hypothetical protein